MASILIALRFVTFGVFVVCNTILSTVGVLNLTLIQNKSAYNAQIPTYLIFLGALGLVCIFPLVFIDLLRRNAFTSRVWVELAWVSIFWIMELSGAAAMSAIVPNSQCLPREGSSAERVCLSGKVLLSFAWLVTLILLAYLVTLGIYAIIHHSIDQNVWNETVREYPWFSTRSTLSSSPPSPVAEKQMELPLQHPRPKLAFSASGLARSLSPFEDPVQPAPIFDRLPEPSYQPPQRRHEGLHFAATQDPSPIIDPAFARPREAPVPPVKVQSLYPDHLQGHLSVEARGHLFNHLSQLEGQEPSPIGDWPRGPRSKGHGRRPPPPRPRINTEASPLTQQRPSSTSPNQRTGSSRTPSAPPPSYRLGQPTWGPQTTSARRQPPPPLNLDGISNTTRNANY